MAISALLCQTWSPEQIVGYQRMHGIPPLSFATIYRWMYAGKLPTVTVAVLRHKGKTTGTSGTTRTLSYWQLNPYTP